ncbi:unnamed protein product [Symbiodinium sp. CCMP2592]|nr:unnamed protein product [Symbiodinium sp. CCMP2592]
MPPKTKGKAKAKAKAAAAAQPADGGADPAAAAAAAVPSSINSSHLSKVQEALQLMRDNSILCDVGDADPLGIDAAVGSMSGTIAPYDAAQLGTALQSRGSYQCGINFTWLDFLTSITPNVPIIESQVADAQRKYFPSYDKGSVQAGKVVVGLLPHQLEALVAGKTPSNLRLLSPEEYAQALLLKIGSRLREGANSSELQGWRSVLLTAPVTFELVPNAEKFYFRGISIREQKGTDRDLLYRSAVQRIYELALYRDSQPVKMTQKQVAEKWQLHVEFSTEREKDEVKDQKTFHHFVEKCLSVYDRVLKHDRIQALVLWAEETWGKQSPWDSVYKLDDLAQKCFKQVGRADTRSALDRMVWCIGAVHDFLQSDPPQLQWTQLSVRNWSGKGCSGNKGTVDVLLMKYGLSVYILDHMESTSMDTAHKQKLRSVFRDFPSYRAAYGEIGHTEQHDLSWIGCLSEAAIQACNLLQKLVYNTGLDAKVKKMLYAGAGPADWLDREELAEDVKAYRAALVQLDSKPDQVEETAATGSGVDPSLLSALQAADPSNNKMEAHVRSLSDESLVRLKEALGAARQRVRQYVKLIVDCERAETMNDLLAESAVGKVQSSDVLQVVFDVKNSGEPVTAPHLRVAAFEKNALKKVVQRTVRALNAVDIPDNCVFTIFDGGKMGQGNHILNSFTMAGDGVTCPGMPKASRTIHLAYDENSVAQRMEKHRASAQLQQLETIYIVHGVASQLQGLKKRRNRAHYAGTSAGNVISGVVLPPDSELWQLTFAEKKALYGSARTAVGGATAGHDPASAGKREEHGLEPFCFHSMPVMLFKELLDVDLRTTVLLDWTAGDGQCAQACLESKVSYVGVCFTDAHKEKLYERLAHIVMRGMRQEGNQFFDAGFAEVIAARAAEVNLGHRGGRGRGNAATGEEGSNADKNDTDTSAVVDETEGSDAILAKIAALRNQSQ